MSCNVCKQLPNLTQHSRCHLALDFSLSENHHVASSWGPACSAASSARCSMRFASCRIAPRSAPLACTLSARKVSVLKCLLSILHHLSVEDKPLRMWDHVIWFAKALWFSSPDISWQGGLGRAHTSYKPLLTYGLNMFQYVSIYVSMVRHESERPPRRPLAVTTSEWPGTVMHEVYEVYGCGWHPYRSSVRVVATVWSSVYTRINLYIYNIYI